MRRLCLLVPAVIQLGCAFLVNDASSEPPPTAPASDARIHGHVTHRKTNAGLEGAIVILQSTNLTEQREMNTDANGYYRFDRLPPGLYNVQVLYQNANVNKSLDTPPGTSYRTNFTLDANNRICDPMPLPRISLDRSLLHENCPGRVGSPVDCRKEDNGRRRTLKMW